MALQSDARAAVARAKAQPGLAAKSDADCEEKINLLSDLIEDYLQCVLGYRTATYLLQGSGTRELILPVAPVVEVTEVLVQGQSLDLAEVATPNDWAERGKLFYKAGWPIECDASNEAGDPDMATIAFPLSVTLRHGYWLPGTAGSKPSDVSVLPERIQRACDIACHLNFASPPGGVQRVRSEKTAGGYAVEFAQESSGGGIQSEAWETFLPDTALLLLAKYCRRDVIL